jgi:hypothetical protein
MAGVVFGVLMGIIAHGAVVSRVVAAGSPPSAAWGVTGLLVLTAVVFALAERFFRRLGEIVDSVSNGDPFVIANAARLEQMGWLALAMNVLALVLGAFRDWLVHLADAALGNALLSKAGIGFSFPGLILILVLFILARVFRQGAAMREELEGTV